MAPDVPPKTITLAALGRLLLRTWPYYRPELKHLVTYASLNIFMGLVILGGTLVAQDVINNKILVGDALQTFQAALILVDDSYVASDEIVTLDDDQRKVVRNRLLIWVGIFVVLMMGSFMGVGYYMTWIYQRINQRLRVSMLERAEHLSLQYHNHARTGDAIYRVYQDSATITNVLQMFVITPLRAFTWLLFGVATLSFFSPWLGLTFVLAAIPIVGFVMWLSPTLQTRALASRETNSALTSNIQEVFSALKVVKANGAEGLVHEAFDRDSTAALDAAFRFRVAIILATTVVAVSLTGLVLVAEYFMAEWTIEEHSTYLGGVVALVGFTVWNLGAFQSASGTAEQSIEQSQDMVSLWANAQDLAVGLERAFFLLDLKPGVVESDTPQAFPAQVESVEWRNVSFAYEQKPVLKNLDLAAQSGSITAIVGGTGSGKSTLLYLLLRLFDPNDGEVVINDIDLRRFAIDELRSHVAIALQQNVLFATTVAENISYASQTADRGEIVQAAQVACADEFIRQMPDGYDTELGERGSKLSAGQRQRLSIARAIVRNTPILILDEPTASLDAETEHRVLENLREWGRNRIVFLITHRLSTIQNADRIALLEDGAIAEVGAHDDLMSIPDGRYHAFVHAEMIGFDDGEETA